MVRRNRGGWERSETLERIGILTPQEPVWLDRDRLKALYEERGEIAAEDIVCRAMEELAVRLSQAEKRHREGKTEDLAHHVRSLVAIAEQIGMDKLARVARDVAHCAEAGDRVGLAATLARLVRLGERSLSAIWEAEQFCP